MSEQPATLMVVDDNIANLGLLRMILTDQGYQVHTAVTGQEAIDRIGVAPPDLVLLDVKMPQMDGFEVCRQLKANQPTQLMPVIMITALGSLEDRVQALEAGADEFLTKPFFGVELTVRIRSLLRVKRLTDQLERAEAVIFALVRTVEAKDRYTQGHSERVSYYGGLLAKALGLSSHQQQLIRTAGLLHDIGKIGIPEQILNKADKLTQEEFDLVRQHPIQGVRICQPLQSLAEVIPAVWHHHEKLDGSGYPDGLKGEAIPLAARVLAVVDVFDALSSHRPYRDYLLPSQVQKVIWHEVELGWWDREIVETLMELNLSFQQLEGVQRGLIMPG